MYDMVGGFKFKGLENRANLALKKSIFRIGAGAKSFFKSGFDKEGFTDRTYKRWERRKRPYRHKILNKSGALAASIKSSTNKTALSTTITSDLKYSAIHNDGLTGDAFGTPFKMPQRQFIGDSHTLDKRVENILVSEIDKLFV